MTIAITRHEPGAGELRREAARCRDARAARRMLALALVLEGSSREEAARAAGMDRQTLRDWVHRYNAEGVEGLRDRPRPGRPCALDEGRQAALRAACGVRSWSATAASLARPRPARAGRAPLRGALQRERGQAAAARARACATCGRSRC